MSLIAAHSTVPRWPIDRPPVDRSGAAFGLVTFGSSGRAEAAEWAAEIAQMYAPCWSLSDDAPDVPRRLEECLSRATTGLRLMIVGPEEDVLRAAAQARAAGLIDAELTLHVTGAPTRAVYCVHCKTTSSVMAEVGEVASCSGCGRGLLVYAHLSRRTGSYLGFVADAEERE